jgi:hypothetical protein
MRTTLFFGVIIILIAASWFIKKNGYFFNKPIAHQMKLKPTTATWNAILPGKWNVLEVDSNDYSTNTTNMELTVSSDYTFNFNAAEKHADNKGDIVFETGGGMKGYLKMNDHGFSLYSENCSFGISKNLYSDHAFLLNCPTDSGWRSYGNISSLTNKYEIKELDTNNFLIIGREYSQNLFVRCQFTREQE